MKIDLIIFDLDGTLVNSIPDLTDSINHVCKLKNTAFMSEESIAAKVGGGIIQLLEDAFGIDKDTDEFKSYMDPFMDYYGKNQTNRSFLYDNVRDTIKKLSIKKLAVLSNKFDGFTKQIIKDFRLDEYFDLVLGTTNDLAKKPSAEPVNYIMNTLGISTDRVFFVGDSENDIKCAKNSGIKSVAVTYGYRSKEQLEVLNPDFIIDDISELTTII
jgi:phosphoglycolate phosphatase